MYIFFLLSIDFEKNKCNINKVYFCFIFVLIQIPDFDHNFQKDHSQNIPKHMKLNFMFNKIHKCGKREGGQKNASKVCIAISNAYDVL